jgi:hypothetical protein
LFFCPSAEANGNEFGAIFESELEHSECDIVYALFTETLPDGLRRKERLHKNSTSRTGHFQLSTFNFQL